MGLNPLQQYLSDIEKSKGKGYSILTANNRQDLINAFQSYFGDIPLPPGVTEDQVVSRNGIELRYKDEDGYEHVLKRNLDARLPNAGEITVETNRPAIDPTSEQVGGADADIANQLAEQLKGLFASQAENINSVFRGDSAGGYTNGIRGDFLDRLLGIADRLSGQPMLANLDPEAEAALARIKAATDQALQQQFDTQSQGLVADLFGRGINKSNIAGQEANRLLQGQGLVKTQAEAEAANRYLALRQFLTQQGQGNLAIAGDQLLGGGGLALNEFNTVQNLAQQGLGQQQRLFTDLLNMFLERDVSGGQLGLGRDQLELQKQELAQNRYFQDEQMEMQRAAARRQMLSQIIGGVVSTGLGLATGGLGFGLAGAKGAAGAAGGASGVGLGAMAKAGA